MQKKREMLFNQALRDFAPMMTRIASAYEKDPELRRDLVQEMALGLWQALAKFEGRASLKTFTARICHYRAVDHVAREKRKPRPTDKIPEILDPKADLETTVERHQEANALVHAVRELPLPLRQVATLALEGFEAREIAETLGITANNASVRLARAKKALKKGLSR